LHAQLHTITPASGWCFWLVLLAGASGWCFWLVLLAGASGWCFWLVLLADLPFGAPKIKKDGFLEF
jgi:hypothetical protein